MDAPARHWLSRRNARIDNAALALAALTVAAVWQAQVPANFWGVSAFLSLPFAVMVAFISLVTLGQGLGRFVDFWRFHEFRHGVRPWTLPCLYLPLAALGLISASKIWL